jgi:NAD(P)H-dependent FMN reductase
MLNVGVVVGSTRSERIGLGVAEWVLERARAGGHTYFELVDVADFDLPLMDELGGLFPVRSEGAESPSC